MLTSSRVGLMLRPASRPVHHSLWLPAVAFINSDWGNPLSRYHHWLPMAFINSDWGNPLSRYHYWNQDRRWSGSNLSVAFINSNQGKPPLTPPLLGSESKNSKHLLEVHDRIQTRVLMMKGPGCNPDMEITDRRLGCDPDVDIGIDDDLIVTGIAFLLRRKLCWACSYRRFFGLTLATRKVFQRILLDLPCPSLGRLELSLYGYPAWCHRFSALQCLLVWWGGLVSWRK